MRFAVISTSLNPKSRSRVLAKEAALLLEKRSGEVDLIDLATFPLPLCDGGKCYGDPHVSELKSQLARADGILMSCPIYNYDISAAGKNLIELTGRDVWTDKVAGFLCAAGGKGSYMSLMGVMGSLMLDFHTTILPRFVYTTGADVEDGALESAEVKQRLKLVVDELARYTEKLRG
ncbi:MAG: NAD(P)H-dependent oxidoreductase [Candidatus Omnitrophica bacterium]|nr:NAD(P)H-dependent oxidoreductase [Candidatus Omnitrophota bacterium]